MSGDSTPPLGSTGSSGQYSVPPQDPNAGREPQTTSASASIQASTTAQGGEVTTSKTNQSFFVRISQAWSSRSRGSSTIRGSSSTSTNSPRLEAARSRALPSSSKANVEKSSGHWSHQFATVGKALSDVKALKKEIAKLQVDAAEPDADRTAIQQKADVLHKKCQTLQQHHIKRFGQVGLDVSVRKLAQHSDAYARLEHTAKDSTLSEKQVAQTLVDAETQAMHMIKPMTSIGIDYSSLLARAANEKPQDLVDQAKALQQAIKATKQEQYFSAEMTVLDRLIENGTGVIRNIHESATTEENYDKQLRLLYETGVKVGKVTTTVLDHLEALATTEEDKATIRNFKEALTVHGRQAMLMKGRLSNAAKRTDASFGAGVAGINTAYGTIDKYGESMIACCQQHSAFTQVLNRIQQENPSGLRRLNRAVGEATDHLTVDTLAILPVQRFPRHELFIKDLHKYSSRLMENGVQEQTLSSETAKLTELSERMKPIGTTINAATAKITPQE